MTKKEKEILADIRNKFSPILNYFEMRQEVVLGDLRPEQVRDIITLMDREVPLAKECAFEIAELLKKFG